MNICLTVNERECQVDIVPGESLLHVLRSQLGLTGTKQGCGTGDCGACTVLLEGKPVNACLVLAAEAQGKGVITIEGMVNLPDLHRLVTTVADKGAVQCGFCTPGMILTTLAALRQEPDISREQLAGILAGNLCRCGNHYQFLDAVAAYQGKSQ